MSVSLTPDLDFYEGSAADVQVATFTDSSDAAGNDAATINWGDGTTTAGQISYDFVNHQFDVCRTPCMPTPIPSSINSR